MYIREYQPSDCGELAQLFYHTVHRVNARDYTKEQLDAWATGQVDLEKWNQTFQEHYSLIAVEDDNIVGFGDIDRTGYLDHLYVHADYQNRGIATAICNGLEQTVQGNIVTHASITAKPFFEKRGYQAVKEQQVERQGISLTNFVMIKSGRQEAGVGEELMHIKLIDSDAAKGNIARIILESLQDWFGIPQAREEYIAHSIGKPFFCAFDGERPVGFLYLKETGRHTVELAVMGVLTECHRQGIGRKLFEEAKKKARQMGYSFIQVKTVQIGRYDIYDDTNRFYQSLGFQELEVFPMLWDEANPCQIYIMAIDG